jgi:Ulp1 family protease
MDILESYDRKLRDSNDVNDLYLRLLNTISSRNGGSAVTVNIRTTVNKVNLMTTEDFRSLNTKTWVRRAIINLFLTGILQERDLNRWHSSKKSIFVSCETSQSILNGRFSDISFNSDLFSREKLFLPISIDLYDFYVLCVVEILPKIIRIYTLSDVGAYKNHVHNQILAWLEFTNGQICAKYNLNRTFDPKEWNLQEESLHVKNELAAVDSGVYVMVCADCISSNKIPPVLSDEDMIKCRRYIGHSLLTGSSATKEDGAELVETLLTFPGPSNNNVFI